MGLEHLIQNFFCPRIRVLVISSRISMCIKVLNLVSFWPEQLEFSVPVLCNVPNVDLYRTVIPDEIDIPD